MKITWTIYDGDHGRPAHVHWAPRATAKEVKRGGVALACSRFAPTNSDANVRESDSPISCRTCAQEYERAQRRGR